MERSIQNILIVHQGALGDFICFLPALSTIRDAFGGAHITLMGYPRILGLVEKRYYADRVLSVDSADIASLYNENPEPGDRLRGIFGGFDLIGMIGSTRGRVIENIRRISKARILAIPPFPCKEMALHMVDHLLSLPRALGIPASPCFPKLYLLDKDRNSAKTFLASRGILSDALLMAVHPGSGSPAKNWPASRFAGLAEALVARYRARILVVLGPGEEESRRELLQGTDLSALIPLDDLPLPVLGAILDKCLAFVGNDSGITHMAAALGMPVVALFGPTNSNWWAPQGGRVRLIRKSVPCSPCERDVMRRCGHRTCLMDISVSEVYQAVCQLVEEECGPSHTGICASVSTG